MAARMTNTMSELLQRMLGDIAQGKTLQDADLPFLLELEAMIVSKLREPFTAGAPAGPAAGPGPAPPPPTPGFMGAGAGPGGLMTGPPPIPAGDELNRVLAG